MSLQEQIDREYIEAYKAHETGRVGVLRLLKTAVKNMLVQLKRPQGALSDEEMLDVIIKQAKQRQDSIEQYTAAGRADLAEKEAAELEILKKYLPKNVSGAELREAVAGIIAECGASSPKDMGMVMGRVMSQFKGRVDGKEVSDLVKKMLLENK